MRNHLWCANDPCGYGIGEGEGEGTCRGHSENSCRLGVLSEPDPDPRIRIVQSDRLISQVCNVRSAPVYVSNRTFSSSIFCPRVFLSLEFFITHSANREADDARKERKES